MKVLIVGADYDETRARFVVSQVGNGKARDAFVAKCGRRGLPITRTNVVTIN